MPEAELARPTARTSAGTQDSFDVAIVGAGLTGLWTAWYLLERDPGLRIVVLERDTIGFGASVKRLLSLQPPKGGEEKPGPSRGDDHA